MNAILLRALQLTLTVSLLLLSGCAVSLPEEPPVTKTPPPPRRFSVVGVDRTGSYELVKPGLQIAARLVQQVNPGDVMVFRWISDVSYLPGELFAELSMPPHVIEDVHNQFDMRAKRRRAEALTQVQALRASTIARLNAQEPKVARRSDIKGFIAAAADAFGERGGDAERWLYLATDLEDNVRYSVKPDLHDVHVVVFAFQPEANPAESAKVKARWEKFFKEMGAVSVLFRSAGVIQ